MTSETKVSRLQVLDAVLLGGEPSADDEAQRAASALRGVFHERGLSIDHPRHLLQAFLADAVNRSCRGWSDLLAYCRYSAAPVGRFLLDLHGEPRDAWPASDALCAALQILNHLQDCQDDWRRLRRLYVPSDWLAAAGLGADALLMSRASPALRGVLDRVLDGVDQLNVTATPLPASIGQRGLRMEAAAIVAISRKLARKLRRRDPLVRRVALTRVEKLAAMASGIVHGWRAR
jgi:farnesyl-diphosphate farnesyltransferase